MCVCVCVCVCVYSRTYIYTILFSTVEGTNIALQGEAVQVSTASWLNAYARQAMAQNAIDGNLDSCSLSISAKDPWWEVWFRESILATVVIITNRADCCGAFLDCVIVVNKSFPKYPNLSLLVPAFCILSLPIFYIYQV